MRFERGRQRVLYTAGSVAEIAQSVGFASSTDFARTYQKAFGARPADEWRHISGLRGLSGAVPPDALAFPDRKGL